MSGTKVRIIDYDRRAPLHKERFAALNREWLERYFVVEPLDEEVMGDPEGAVLEAGGLIVMAEVDGEIVGTGSLFLVDDGVFEIAKMAVTDRFQGRGIGEQLLLALIARAEAMGAHRLFIVSNTSLGRAIRLYRRHGFIDSPEIRHAHYARGNITLEKPLLDRKAKAG